MPTRDSEEAAKPLDGFLRRPRARFNLRQPLLKNWTVESVFFDGDQIGRLPGQAQSLPGAAKSNVDPG